MGFVPEVGQDGQEFATRTRPPIACMATSRDPNLAQGTGAARARARLALPFPNPPGTYYIGY